MGGTILVHSGPSKTEKVSAAGSIKKAHTGKALIITWSHSFLVEQFFFSQCWAWEDPSQFQLSLNLLLLPLLAPCAQFFQGENLFLSTVLPWDNVFRCKLKKKNQIYSENEAPSIFCPIGNMSNSTIVLLSAVKTLPASWSYILGRRIPNTFLWTVDC